MFQNQICSGDFEDLAGTKQPGETPSTGTHYYRLPPRFGEGKIKEWREFIDIRASISG